MIIACTYKTGGDFDGDYVLSLYNQIGYYHRFVCFTDADDVPNHIEQIKLKNGWKGWWSKIEVLGYDDDILMFDLDTVIVGSIMKLIYIAKKSWHNLVMLSDFYFPEKPASGLMYIPNGIGNHLYRKFEESPQDFMNQYRGDQDFIADHWHGQIDRWDDLLGKNYICSYKAHIKKSHPQHIKPLNIDTSKSRIICFHGKPRPRDIKDIWNECNLKRH